MICDIFQIRLEHVKMGIYHIFIVSKSGGLIFNYDHNIPQLENEKVRWIRKCSLKAEMKGLLTNFEREVYPAFKTFFINVTYCFEIFIKFTEHRFI